MINTIEKALFAKGDAEDLARMSSAVCSEHASAALDGLQRHRPGAATVLVAPMASGVRLVVVNDDMPFLLDSTLAELSERGLSLRFVAHPILGIERDGKGNFQSCLGAATGHELPPVARESVILIEVDARLDEAACAALQAALIEIYRDIRLAVRDWSAMRLRVGEVATRLRVMPPPLPADELAEAVQFLDWLLAENFTFLGVREYRFADPDLAGEPKPGIGLGILADPGMKVLRRGQELMVMTPEIRAYLKEKSPLFVQKANVKSRIHRRVYLDYIGVKLFDAAGLLEGELRLVGLFTSTAYTGSVKAVPYLRHKAARVVEAAGYSPASHSGKALLNVLETYPRDELFQIDLNTLKANAGDILALSERPRLRVLARVDRFDRFVSVIVFVPKDRYDTSARLKIGAYLAKAYQGRVSAAYPAYPEGPLARTHYVIGRSEGTIPIIPRAILESDIGALVRNWSDDFTALLESISAERTIRPQEAERFPPAYRDFYSAGTALLDLGCISRLSPLAPFAFDLRADDKGGAEEATLRVFSQAQPVTLSNRVPILENLGFLVISERSFELGGGVHMHDMRLRRATGGAIELSGFEAGLEAALLQIFAGRLESDRFNLLITEAGLTPREADILRAYARYLRQIGVPYGQIYIADALARYPEAVRGLVTLHALRFDPDGQADEKAINDAHARLISAVDRISSLDDDRILRRMVNLIDATLRTNVFQRDEQGNRRPTIAFKLRCADVEGMPLPRPLYEIFVASPDVEGLHLRFGKVARGGLRWSDRPMDFRTEILGLVKAQQVKNAVIVPVGAKGGFVPKLLPSPQNRDAWLAEGTRAYKIFINALLDLTDSIEVGKGEASKIRPPQRTIRRDGDDAYLVVAADKGTATFSDTANALSEARNHWLGDAFASGGSAGYDHKKMGITARGAWEAVKRHFREMDQDIQRDAFTVAGVGDMSGDVFGNGMLLSPEIRLVAAFDHRDIFIDPAPDAAAGFKERTRLFALPRSSWQDYDKALISRGGGIFPRSLKSIPLSSEVQALLGIAAQEATPQMVMQAILRMQVDLLWFGGIGTYIRAGGETDADVGDRANDAIRITGSAIRARVIGEGANLGLTQRGRIEAAQAGVRLNTDAIDNSAGVNSSDVEVNLKIALALPETQGTLTRADRNLFLAGMTDEVAGLVLRNNYLQSLALSLAQRQGVALNSDMTDLMHMLEAEGRLDRKVEYLPDDQEIAARTARGEGLTRPELAILLAYAKLSAYDDLLATDFPDEPALFSELKRYFPTAMQTRFPQAIKMHRLRREIVTTQMVNAVINRCGPGIFTRLKAKTRRPFSQIALAYALARDCFGILDINLGIDALDSAVPGAFQNALYAEVSASVTDAMLWFLRNIDIAAGLEPLLSRFRDGLAAASIQPAEALLMRRGALVEQGVPAALAERICRLPLLITALDATLIAEKARGNVGDAMALVGDLANRLGMDDLRQKARQLSLIDPFERLALDRALATIDNALREIAADILTKSGTSKQPLDRWAVENASAVNAIKALISRLEKTGITQAGLSVLAGDLQGLR